MRFAIRVSNSHNETKKYIRVGSIDDLQPACENLFPRSSRSVYCGLIMGSIVPYGGNRYTLANEVFYETDEENGNGWFDKSDYRVYYEGKSAPIDALKSYSFLR